MRKLLIGLVVLVALAFGGYKFIEVTSYGGTTYYTKVVTTGQKIVQRADDGATWTDYRYRQSAYTKDGAAKTITFNGNKSRPLRQGAYLRLTVNDQKGVTRWAAVPKSAVPAAALAKLP
ncbi:YxeA family protein [Lacticaseibacillus parakribbianus]|uniref:YxeA family protein n=1 Tax=Lacticaseibacillus parakribbianus TaxID=2970927 RepID=UPI0021CB235F|nr:YxeA family protein [Lacticaseibacillus parakribbianus]